MNKKNKLSWDAYEKIMELIKNRRYKPGDPLPEEELSEILGMSRTPIREALHRLEDVQVVVIKPHLGAFVATFDLVQIRNIYETREAVTGMVTRLACKPNISTSIFVNLRKRILEIKDVPDEAERVAKLNDFASDYNTALHSSCDNPMLAKLSVSLIDRISMMGYVTRIISFFPDASLPERLAVLDAIIAKDVEKAEEAARQHVRNSFSRIILNLGQYPAANDAAPGEAPA
jgi:DNA-binding GntR family transcriptional regulator